MKKEIDVGKKNYDGIGVEPCDCGEKCADSWNTLSSETCVRRLARNHVMIVRHCYLKNCGVWFKDDICPRCEKRFYEKPTMTLIESVEVITL